MLTLFFWWNKSGKSILYLLKITLKVEIEKVESVNYV